MGHTRNYLRAGVGAVAGFAAVIAMVPGPSAAQITPPSVVMVSGAGAPGTVRAGVTGGGVIWAADGPGTIAMTAAKPATAPTAALRYFRVRPMGALQLVVRSRHAGPRRTV